MSYYPIELRDKAILLRRKGHSIKEIAVELKIAKSTSSIWLRDVLLSSRAQLRLKKRRILGQYKARLGQINKAKSLQIERTQNIISMLSDIKFSKELCKFCCSLLYWCEGNKDKDNFVRFTNSDPSLIKAFLLFLRKGFGVDESKFRVLMHLHQYHIEEKQKTFWSKITKIPSNQFYKTYLKPNTGKRKHIDYPGCIAISYYDAKVAKELITTYNSFLYRGVG